MRQQYHSLTSSIIWLHTQRGDGVNIFAYGVPQKTVIAIMMLYENTSLWLWQLYENTKAIVRLPDGDTDYFDIVTGVLKGDTFDSYLFIIRLHNELRTSIDLMKENGFKLAKERRRYPTQTITDTGYTDDLALLANTPGQAKSLLNSLGWVAGGIDLLFNTDKTEYRCFNQRGYISTQKGGPLKLEDKFTYVEGMECYR